MPHRLPDCIIPKSVRPHAPCVLLLTPAAVSSRRSLESSAAWFEIPRNPTQVDFRDPSRWEKVSSRTAHVQFKQLLPSPPNLGGPLNLSHCEKVSSRTSHVQSVKILQLSPSPHNLGGPPGPQPQGEGKQRDSFVLILCTHNLYV